jgi:hypothetical protein
MDEIEERSFVSRYNIVVIFHMDNNRGTGRPNRGVGCDRWGVTGLVGNMDE